MNKSDLKKQIFTVPNILTYLRILSIPFFMYFTIAKSTYILQSSQFPMGFPFIGFLIMVVAASTDLIDGWIARRFNQVSDLGKLLDPLADKLMHTAAVLSLVIIEYVHWIFIALIVLKEAVMVIGGIVLANGGKIVNVKMLGKVASALLSVGVFMSYFHPFFAQKVFYLDWIIIGISILLAYVVFGDYLKQGIIMYKDMKKEKINPKENDDI